MDRRRSRGRKRNSPCLKSPEHRSVSAIDQSNGDVHYKLSIRMNKVFNQIGVNDEMIQFRRNGFLQIECNETAIKYANWAIRDRPFYFGSQSEGTTTLGMPSDMDTVLLPRTVLVVQTSKELSKLSGDLHVFELRKSTNPGYFILYDNPNQYPNLMGILCRRHHKKGTRNLKNSFTLTLHWYGEIPKMEGPAIYHETLTGDSINLLWAFPCSAWPLEIAGEFISNQRHRGWPSKDLTDQILLSECFFVPKGSDIGENSDIEWRISFSCGERLLMFDLNIVQIRCYILMKYIKTTFLDNVAGCEGVVSSYICKTVLFHVISRSQNCVWIEDELLAKLNHCLHTLQTFIDERNCPHFIMHSINLLAGKLDESKCKLLSDELQRIIESKGRALYDIQIDNFGYCLMTENTESINKNKRYEIQKKIVFDIICHLGAFRKQTYHACMCMLSEQDTPLSYTSNQPESIRMSVCTDLRSRIKRLFEFSRDINQKDQRMISGVKIETCKLSLVLGSLLASEDFEKQRGLSHDAFQWMLLGTQCSDAASSYLKLASVLFSNGDIEFVEILLRDIEIVMIRNPFVTQCVCEQRSSTITPLTDAVLDMYVSKSFPQFFRDNVQYCIRFLPPEILCCPKEMRYEMYRTTFCDQQSLQQVYPLFTSWMKCAVIPPEPFLYFMQYKLYQHVPVLREFAMKKLKKYAFQTVMYKHQETVVNLVAQCWESEGDVIPALHAYRCSLALRPKNNAARILLCCCLNKLFNLDNG